MHDLTLANTRIIERDKDFYGIKNISDLVLQESDFTIAQKVHEKEAQIIFNGNKQLTNEGLFRGIVYSLLTPMQKYDGQVKGFKALFGGDLDLNLENTYDTQEITISLSEAGVLFPNQKAQYIHAAQQVVINHNFMPLLEKSLGTSREQEVELRNYFISEIKEAGAKGVGQKTASILLRMCGAEHLIPIDSWMMEILYFHGYPCEMPRAKIERPRWKTEIISVKDRKIGLNNEQYLEAEDFALDLAKKYRVSGPLLQLAFWAKKSTYSSNIK